MFPLWTLSKSLPLCEPQSPISDMEEHDPVLGPHRVGEVQRRKKMCNALVQAPRGVRGDQ